MQEGKADSVPQLHLQQLLMSMPGVHFPILRKAITDSLRWVTVLALHHIHLQRTITDLQPIRLLNLQLYRGRRLGMLSPKPSVTHMREAQGWTLT